MAPVAEGGHQGLGEPPGRPERRREVVPVDHVVGVVRVHVGNTEDPGGPEGQGSQGEFGVGVDYFQFAEDPPRPRWKSKSDAVLALEREGNRGEADHVGFIAVADVDPGAEDVHLVSQPRKLLGQVVDGGGHTVYLGNVRIAEKPDPHRAYTTSPPRMVISTPISSSGAVRGSAESTTRSARFPGASSPISSSAKSE